MSLYPFTLNTCPDMPLYYCKVKGAEVEGAVVSEPLNFLYLSCIYALKSYIIKLSLSVCMCVCVCVCLSGIDSQTMRTTVMKLLQVIQRVKGMVSD